MKESFDQLLDLDRFDPLASTEQPTALDYSSLPLEELEKLIDNVYSQNMSPECEAAIIGKSCNIIEQMNSSPLEALF